jgi:uncharacterized short protein YbdD (DUF466 family)
MLADTLKTFREGMHFAGIEKSDREIKAAIGMSSLDTLQEMERETGFNEKPMGMESFFRSGRAASWKEHLDSNETKILVNKHRAFIERFGYSSDN